MYFNQVEWNHLFAGIYIEFRLKTDVLGVSQSVQQQVRKRNVSTLQAEHEQQIKIRYHKKPDIRHEYEHF
jgi:hypothetical protein